MRHGNVSTEGAERRSFLRGAGSDSVVPTATISIGPRLERRSLGSFFKKRVRIGNERGQVLSPDGHKMGTELNIFRFGRALETHVG